MKYTCITKYIDKDTGEILKETTVKEEYIIIKTIKHVRQNPTHTRGYIEYTRECRRKEYKQLKCL